MSTARPRSNLGVTAAAVWVMAWAIGFAAIGFNHLLTRQSDGPRLFLVAGVLVAFLVSLWLASSRPRSRVALAFNLVMLGVVLLAAVLIFRNPALMSLRWSHGPNDRILFASRAWVAIIWLSIICAGGAAEVHHVLHGPAR